MVGLANAARRLAKARRLMTGLRDELSRSIIEILAVRGPLNISRLTLELRKRRGRASRRIVSDRVKMLKEKGLVTITSKGREKIVDIPDDEEINRHG